MFDVKLSGSIIQYPDWVHTVHGQDIPFVFGEPFLKRFRHKWTEAEEKISKISMTYWANFAKTG